MNLAESVKTVSYLVGGGRYEDALRLCDVCLVEYKVNIEHSLCVQGVTLRWPSEGEWEGHLAVAQKVAEPAGEDVFISVMTDWSMLQMLLDKHLREECYFLVIKLLDLMVSVVESVRRLIESIRSQANFRSN